MQVKIEYFAIYQDLLGLSEETVELEEGSTVQDLFELKTKDLKDRAELMKSTVFALNSDYADSSTVLSDGDEVVFIPPVSGG